MKEAGIVSIVDRLQWVRAVIEEPGLLMTAYRVAVELACYKNAADGRCDPSMATLARNLQIDKRSARRAIRQLEDRGYLQLLPSIGGNYQATHQYWFSYPQRGTEQSALRAQGGPSSPPRGDRSGRTGGTGRSSKHSKEHSKGTGSDKSRGEEKKTARYARAPGAAGRLFANGRFLDED